ncbi:MAG TPA: hypothetical protein ENN07_00905 [candidate division Zixibacteria bacterium]|nr:hypothetical protein [candidate division Zixibacteria bacterium]
MSLNVPMVVAPDARYAYATGVVRGKWQKRLGRSEFARILEAEPENVGKVIAELGFTGADSDVETALADEWRRTVELVESLIGGDGLAKTPRMLTDFTNIAVAIKAELFEFEYEPNHLAGGNVSAERLMELVSGEPPQGHIEQMLADIANDARNAYSDTELKLTIDSAIDSHFGEWLKEIMFASGREFLVEFARRWLDYKNFTAYLRLRVAGFDIEHFKQFFVEGGHLPREEFARWEDGEIDAIPSRLVFSIYGKPLADAVGASIRERNFSPMSAFFDVMIEDFLRNNVYVPFGVEVVVAFAFLKLREIRAVGAIARMKSARLDREAISERVRYGDI